MQDWPYIVRGTQGSHLVVPFNSASTASVPTRAADVGKGTDAEAVHMQGKGPRLLPGPTGCRWLLEGVHDWGA